MSCGELPPEPSGQDTAAFEVLSESGAQLVEVEEAPGGGCEPPPPPLGDEGCTPGFWKNHPEAWQVYATHREVDTVFTFPAGYDANLTNATLLEALQGGGGPDLNGAATILLRAAVAALLNASHSGIDYPLTTAQVIAQVNAALATKNREAILALATQLDEYNNGGCDL